MLAIRAGTRYDVTLLPAVAHAARRYYACYAQRATLSLMRVVIVAAGAICE